MLSLPTNLVSSLIPMLIIGDARLKPFLQIKTEYMLHVACCMLQVDPYREIEREVSESETAEWEMRCLAFHCRVM